MGFVFIYTHTQPPSAAYLLERRIANTCTNENARKKISVG